ncbi:collagen alpha-1(XIV) chain-like [Biomphalaria glabrata]|uniref:Collagen alpha-1(XIV) chain-like n=1 Tax=Biomphalaria glabrata TaxID=6526 RepID=A0A9W2Z5P3_BIOGL|nr:collagen alpha-1(XIV) chain-like [Biomphalaria glabrata]
MNTVTLLLLLFTVLDKTTAQPCIKSVDIVFAIDVSYSIQYSNFQGYLLPFIQNFVSGYDVGPNFLQARVGALTFSDEPHLAFLLDAHLGKPEVLRAIADIPYQGGETYTSKALKFARENMFGPQHGGRADAERVLIVLTDGRSYNTTSTVQEASLCKQQGIAVFAIGVGNADEGELKAMANFPAEKYMYYVNGFQALASLQSTLLDSTCGTSKQIYNDENKDSLQCDLPCSGRAADIVFVIDESYSIGGDTFNSVMLPFLQQVVHHLDVGPYQQQIRVGALAFGTFPRMLFRLNAFTDKSRLVSAISKIRYVGGDSNINTALAFAKDQMLGRLVKGVRGGATPVIVLLTDGKSENRQATVSQAEAARQCGIEIFAVGVGEADQDELSCLVSQPIEDHLFYANDFRDLNSISTTLSSKLSNC